jgi:hypothetical protein
MRGALLHISPGSVTSGRDNYLPIIYSERFSKRTALVNCIIPSTGSKNKLKETGAPINFL